MAEEDLVKNMLLMVLQSRPFIPLSCLQDVYEQMTGETIPFKELGYATLNAMLQSMSAVVHLENASSGEVICSAKVKNEPASIANLVARQHAGKKTGRPLVVNCQLRVKPSGPLMINANPRSSLRQPDQGYQGQSGDCGGSMREPQPDGRDSESSIPPNTPKGKGSLPSDRTDKRMNLPPRLQKEVHAHLFRPPQPSNASDLNGVPPSAKSHSPPSSHYNPKLVQSRLKEVLSKHSNGFWVSKLPQLYRELYKQELSSEALKDLETWTHICIVEKPCSSKPNELLLYPAKDPNGITTWPTPALNTLSKRQSSQKPPTQIEQAPTTASTSTSGPQASVTALPEDLKQKLAQLLHKYSRGVWSHALPKLFQDTYNAELPESVLDNLSLLSDLCTIDYPMASNPKRAILYVRVTEDENCSRPNLVREVAARRFSTNAVPPLLIPKEEYPSVLVVEADSTNNVVIRYIGQDYSKAQEKLEDEMRESYKQEHTRMPLNSPSPGMLAAVVGEEEEGILRGQVSEVKSDSVTVYYVDHGESEVVSKNRLIELHERFLKLPFQATKCKLAGLEAFSQEPTVLEKLDSMASGKILLAEILQRKEIPLMVLYDTSQEGDININVSCRNALQDRSLESPLQVNSTHMNVSVTSVCSDGTFSCQLPSRGLSKLNELLQKIESNFRSQVPSEPSRPFCGKCGLVLYKDRWSRAEITNLHGNRVLDILFVDLGVQASIKVSELKDIPPSVLRDFISIPPQAVKCCLTDLSLSLGSWTPDAVQWLKDAILHRSDINLKIAKVEERKRLAHVYLFTSKKHEPINSLNHQLANSDLWKRKNDVFLSSNRPLKNITPSTASVTALKASTDTSSTPEESTASYTTRMESSYMVSHNNLHGGLALPLVLELPKVGQNIDIYVSVACHPGHFVLQPWQDMYKLAVLMGEMILHYNQSEEKLLKVEKNQVYAAKVENNWHRVLVKGVLTNGLVSVYELDYGKHELVSGTFLRPLIQKFRQLPFQGITAQLAGVKARQWSEEASIVFRNHVEKKALVARVESVQDAAQPWDRKLTVYLVDTSQEDRDSWIHDIMAEFTDGLTKAA